ncbi:Carboxynorspermidine decarboxylase, putative [hydrothermal vent metagenome]|uniref:Carboxynorspermidine decarboxylase, putative n=1 Tax=hydrothermal vent metagenome TaxID=652676 RepID=A0A1W1EKR4_9ZZZZ
MFKNIKTPAWIIEEKLLKNNLETMRYIKEETNCKILLALKGYAIYSTFDIINQYLDGCCASGLNEALLSSQEFAKETHTYSPAFKEEEIEEIAKISNHLVFNSISQFKKYSQKAKEINPNISIGIRVNPEYSSSPVEKYNPCGLHSRLGVKIEDFDISILEGCDGLHFHALCEQGAEELENLLIEFEKKFGKYLYQMKWINFGGGHHITKDGYNIKLLIKLINKFKTKYSVDIYLEPGEAIGWRCGVLVATVVDIVHNGMDIAILDISAEAHMPDTIIMPYRAEIRGASENYKFLYKISGNSCLAGDIMGDYRFKEKLNIGDKVVFEDQIHYTIVKATTFNGVALPSISILKENGVIHKIKEFGYNDFKNRLS